MLEDFGKILASWQVPEYDEHERSMFWYIGFGALGLGLIIYAIATANYLFALIIVLAAVIIYFQHRGTATRVDFLVTGKGIKVGNREYSYRDLKQFWILYNPPLVKKLYFSFQSSLTPRLMIPLRNQNPLKVREILLSFLGEDLEKEEEPLSEVFAKWTKL
ncbi:MAG: hypothetical protein A2295_03290 [Candidatus Jacksonbacteria bacterium RIFOXYB2_FULL_44_15]|nr:MAG: hypothetical protein A2295_03290 [Candidatus Jacksonbacteria bacterium RIFOXYB2_FULL_44_15]OGY81555.1 MAG: hypothetical protein A2550_00970 [Candidatus Jacksonbacteria bacterium RIFOXYD2_FULL_43_21]HCR15563.1 hypothetical protein [Candidatus Jacksonbacteria bacterium]